jgi:hypothetical protein
MGWRNALLTASSVLVLAGCGGEHKAAPQPPPPRIPAAVASRLAGEADRVAALTPGTCEARDAAARLRREVIASIGRIPARYQEPLTSAANTLAERLATCVESKPNKEHEGGNGHGQHREKRDHGGGNGND